jgi:hypothetical protein
MVLRFFFFAFLLGCAEVERDNPQDPNNVDGKAYSITVRNGIKWMGNLNHKASGSKCYNDDPKNCEGCGRLYNWSTAKDVCPGGWRLPSDAEIRALTGRFFSKCGQYDRSYGGSGFDNMGIRGFYWSSEGTSWSAGNSFDTDDIHSWGRGGSSEYNSVRCVKDLIKEDL